jgi:hypothetical protein
VVGGTCSADDGSDAVYSLNTASDETIACALLPHLVTAQCEWNDAMTTMVSDGAAGAIGAAFMDSQWQQWIAMEAIGYTGNDDCDAKYDLDDNHGMQPNGDGTFKEFDIDAVEVPVAETEAPVPAPTAPRDPSDPVETTKQTLAIVVPDDATDEELTASAAALAETFSSNDGAGTTTTVKAVIQQKQDVTLPDNASADDKAAVLHTIEGAACGAYKEDECMVGWDARRTLRGRALASASYTVTFTLDPQADDFETPVVTITAESLNAALVDAGSTLVIESISVATTSVSIEVTVETVAAPGAAVAEISADDLTAAVEAVAANIDGLEVADIAVPVVATVAVVTTSAPVVAPTAAPTATTIETTTSPVAAPVIAPSPDGDTLSPASKTAASCGAAVAVAVLLNLAL